MATTRDPGGHSARQRAAESVVDDAARPPSADCATFSEAIDRRTGSIRASGHLDSRAADMLGGTVEALHRSGCGQIVLDLGGVQAVDGAGLDALHSLEKRIRAQGGRVALLNVPGPRSAPSTGEQRR